MDAITNSCINQMTNDNDTESSSQIFQIPEIRDIGSNHKILDTRDLSQVNLVWNNIMFQVCPDPKITNERSRAADVRLREDESDHRESFYD
jgi:hypothetical protein